MIKVWSLTQRKCLFTLVGHLDYIRTVQVRPCAEMPHGWGALRPGKPLR